MSNPNPKGRIVRLAITVVTIALVFASTMNAAAGHRDIAILFALGAPLGIASWSFARAGMHEAAVVLLSCVLVTIITLTLVLSPLGVHDHAVIGYSGILLFNALMLSRRAFVMMAGLALAAGGIAFAAELLGYTNSLMGPLTRWTALVDFLLITLVIGIVGRAAAEMLAGSLDTATLSAVNDPVTGLANRARFQRDAGQRLDRAPEQPGQAVLVVGDLVAFRRINHVVGHAAADRILKEAGRRVAGVAPTGVCGRVGDDEFALLVTGLPDAEACERVAGQVCAALQFEHDGVSVRATVGRALVGRDGRGIEALLMAADQSLAKACGERRAATATATATA